MLPNFSRLSIMNMSTKMKDKTMNKHVYVLRYHLPHCSSEFERTFNTESEARALLLKLKTAGDASHIRLDEVTHLDI